MNRLTSLSVLSLLLMAGSFQASPLSPLRFRVLTYNIHHGEGTDGRFDLERVAAVMKTANPDLVALQEVDLSTVRASGVNQLAELARLMDMRAEFGKAMSYDGGSYGVAVLSRWPLLAVENDGLPFAAEREPRTALTVQLRPGPDGPLFQFTSTHFDNGREPDTRVAQATRVNELLTRPGPPSILAGDMNARPDTDVMKILGEQWSNALTEDAEPTGRPRLRGDYVLYRPAACWRIVETTVLEDRVASDHRPVLVVLEWTGNP